MWANNKKKKVRLQSLFSDETAQAVMILNIIAIDWKVVTALDKRKKSNWLTVRCSHIDTKSSSPGTFHGV